MVSAASEVPGHAASPPTWSASQPDTGELYAIHVEDSVVTTETLWMPRNPGFGIPLY